LSGSHFKPPALPEVFDSNTDNTVRKWIKEGRGAGKGKDYKPWLTVRDVSSVGRSHRIFGHKSKRTHHLLSDLELAVFLLLEWHPDTEDIREQFPLRLEETQPLAVDAGILHPVYRGKPQIMTSDFLVNTRNSKEPKFVLQTKYSVSL
jgi:TnsA endonuclease N terminal